MKLFQKKHALLTAVIAASLTGCGNDDGDESGKPIGAAAPTHSGDITVNLHESDDAQVIDLLQDAVDPDADILRVENLTASKDDETGFDASQEVRIGVDPSAIAPMIGTGDTYQMVYTYDISDGQNSTQRTATIRIEGEDFAPEFDQLKASYDASEDAVTIDLLQGATDADGDELSISGFTASSENPVDNYSVSGSELSIDIPAFTGDIGVGEFLTLRFTYNVEDGNHSVERTAAITISAVVDEPEAPMVNGTFSGSFTTNDSIAYVQLNDPEYIVDRNGDPLTIEWDTVTPTNGGPELSFDKSSGTQLVIDPVDFATHIDTVGTTETFEYSFDVNDGDDGFEISTSFSVEVTREAPLNLISNGSFETGDLSNWSTDNSAVIAVEAAADAWEGDYQVVSTGEPQLSGNFDVEENAGYLVRQVDRVPNWGGYSLNIIGADESEDFSRRFGIHPPYVDGSEKQWTKHAFHTASFVTGPESSDSRTAQYSMVGMNMDDVVGMRYSTDIANNHVAKMGAYNVGFEDGTMGDWIVSDGDNASITEDPEQVISGSYSLYMTSWNSAQLTLPAGTIENGKKYLLSMDMRILTSGGSGNSPMSLAIYDAADGSTSPVGTSLEAEVQPRSRNFFFETDGELTKFEQYIDVDAFTDVDDWASRSVMISFNPNLWNPNAEVVIDNVILVEVP
ncbi:Ig-like domain-containing protein [Marinimicrobium sp. C2-29]|uniref:Ig-like domain-containing protein n=1 Tax=Marinimicrobium sp. C2-29 TaxID=3139825 RepID=UPI003138983F